MKPNQVCAKIQIGTA